MELIEDFEASTYFRQLILADEGEFGYKLPIKGSNIQEPTSCKPYFYYY